MFHRLNRTAARVVGGVALAGALAGGGLAMATPAHAATTVPDVLAKIRYCESGNNYSAVNASSGASGAYQFLDSTWRGLSSSAGYSTAASAPAAVQDAAAVELYNQQGTTPWVSSQSCWAALGAVPTTTTSTSTTTTAAATTSATAATSTTTAATAQTQPATAAQPAQAPQQPAAQQPANQPAAGQPGTAARQQAAPAATRVVAERDVDRVVAGHAGAGAAPSACR